MPTKRPDNADTTTRPVEVFLRTAHNYDMNIAGNESGLNCQDKSLAQQHFAEESDINTIVKRFNLTGELPNNVRMPVYEDFTGIFDFHSAMNAIALAREAFDQMPADVRARFHNDPQEFVDFTADRRNIAEARRLGLVPPEELPEPKEPDHRPHAAGDAHEPLRDDKGQFRGHTQAELKEHVDDRKKP